jgi:hypothetical protein
VIRRELPGVSITQKSQGLDFLFLFCSDASWHEVDEYVSGIVQTTQLKLARRFLR